MKKYRKNDREVDAVQFDGSEESINEIREILGDKADRVAAFPNMNGSFSFSMICRKENKNIYNTDWIVKDGQYFFVVSNDVFQNMFTEVESDES